MLPTGAAGIILLLFNAFLNTNATPKSCTIIRAEERSGPVKEAVVCGQHAAFQEVPTASALSRVQG